MLLVIFLRFVNLQVFKHQQYKDRAGANSIRKISLHAPRGIIYDRNGIELVSNGVLLNDKLIAELPLYLDRIIISLEGLSEEDYVKFTNKKINFDEFVEKLGKLHAVESECVRHIKIQKNVTIYKQIIILSKKNETI